MKMNTKEAMLKDRILKIQQEPFGKAEMSILFDVDDNQCLCVEVTTNDKAREGKPNEFYFTDFEEFFDALMLMNVLGTALQKSLRDVPPYESDSE